ncbi:retrovirus-related pol polyprotein from transposon TNT 1-94 [Tanacetum coccineum]
MGNSNVIPYEQYLLVNDISGVPSCASSALNSVCVSPVNDAFIPSTVYDQKTKTALGAQNPFYLRQAKKAQPALYDGDELLKPHHVPVIVSTSEEELELAEATRNKLHVKMNDSVCVEKRARVLMTLALAINKMPLHIHLGKKGVTFVEPHETSTHNTPPQVEHQKINSTNVPGIPSTGVKGALAASGITGKLCPFLQIVLWYLDSGCSKHMTGDRSRLRNFVKKFIGTVRFGNDHFGAIMGYGDYVIGDSVISRIYLLKALALLTKRDVLRTPQQNGVVERRNRTLVEAARTMLIFSKAPLFLWAEAVATACYTQN